MIPMPHHHVLLWEGLKAYLNRSKSSIHEPKRSRLVSSEQRHRLTKPIPMFQMFTDKRQSGFDVLLCEQWSF